MMISHALLFHICQQEDRRLIQENTAEQYRWTGSDTIGHSLSIRSLSSRQCDTSIISPILKL